MPRSPTSTSLQITEQRFDFHLLEDQIAAEAALDGIYVIRTGVPSRQMTGADAVRNYKALAGVERAFRSLKTVDLKVRPIHHRLEDRVRAHIFLCMLAYYLEWHLREAWRPLLFADEDQAAKADRDPVAPAQRFAEALQKVLTHTLADGTPAHSLRTLLDELSTLARNTCRTPGSAQLARLRLADDPNRLAAPRLRTDRPDRRVDRTTPPDMLHAVEASGIFVSRAQELQPELLPGHPLPGYPLLNHPAGPSLAGLSARAQWALS